uniref:Uncharacterized protein n=1 Tax=Rhizophora mucronata TaxID=61149 RepID=A0A2P2PRY6_RHIMU
MISFGLTVHVSFSISSILLSFRMPSSLPFLSGLGVNSR